MTLFKQWSRNKSRRNRNGCCCGIWISLSWLESVGFGSDLPCPYNSRGTSRESATGTREGRHPDGTPWTLDTEDGRMRNQALKVCPLLMPDHLTFVKATCNFWVSSWDTLVHSVWVGRHSLQITPWLQQIPFVLLVLSGVKQSGLWIKFLSTGILSSPWVHTQRNNNASQKIRSPKILS